MGETWLASALLDGALDDEGMLCDFGIVKKRCAIGWTTGSIIACCCPFNTRINLSDRPKAHRLNFHAQSGEPIRMSAPVQAVALVDAAQSTSKRGRMVQSTAFRAFFRQCRQTYAEL